MVTREIEYRRHEFRFEPERRRAPLPYFLLDIPYLFFRGFIPPLSVINEVLKGGGGDAGMSPGASWQPFVLTGEEYGQLVEELRSLDLNLAREQARFVPPALREDDSLHRCRDFVSWLRAVKGKHGADTG